MTKFQNRNLYIHGMRIKGGVTFSLFLGLLISFGGRAQSNFIVIVADDFGVDVCPGYFEDSLMATTPTLDSLRAAGLMFENAWSYPVCTSTRAASISGKYGIKTGVMKAPGNLDMEHKSIFDMLDSLGGYKSGVFGKWHISMPQDPDHPGDHGVDYYHGILGANWDTYFSWQRTINGAQDSSFNYASIEFTNEALSWVNTQTDPWLLWMAHIAPHTPLHVPPDSMYSINATGTPYRKYIAMIESLDYEVARLLAGIPDSVEENTTILFFGDNGTANNLLRQYPANHGKSSVYEGGVRVPMFISGPDVTRVGERERGLVHVMDLYATLSDLAGANLPGGWNNSLSLAGLLQDENANSRPYNYTEIENDEIEAWAIRNQSYKLIQYVDSVSEFYHVEIDSLETTDLIPGGLTAEQDSIMQELALEASVIRTGWSCNDLIQNGDEEGIDCGGSGCAVCNSSVSSSEEDNRLLIFPNPATKALHVLGSFEQFYIYSVDGKLVLSSRQNTADISKLDAGMYLIKVRLKSGGVHSQSFVKTDNQ